MGPADGSLLGKMVEAFAAEAPANLTTLSQALHAGDGSGVSQGAHRLRGAASNMGATEVALLCAQLEQMAMEDRLDGAAALLDGLGTELARATTALRNAVVARTS